MNNTVPTGIDKQDGSPSHRDVRGVIADAIIHDWHDAGMYGRAEFDPRWLDGLATATADVAASAAFEIWGEPVFAAAAIDGLDASDPEAAHSNADEIVLANVHPIVAAAYARLVERADWWAGA